LRLKVEYEETERTVTENSRTLNFRNQGFEKQ
jgi:hypothetical protein